MQSESLITKPIAGNIDARALRIVAKSVYKELKTAGYQQNDIVSFTGTMIELVTEELRKKTS